MEGSPKGNSQSSAIVKRTSKQEGTIRLRFRLRDGRGVNLYHKYLNAKQKIALAAKTDNENKALRQCISELDEKAVAREKSRADAAERKAQEQTMRGDREEKRANEAEKSLSDMIQFIRVSGASEAYEHWNYLHTIVKKAAQALADCCYRKQTR